jgi:uncharacterized protein YbdZ (MbtH family)
MATEQGLFHLYTETVLSLWPGAIDIPIFWESLQDFFKEHMKNQLKNQNSGEIII